jgi:hypothetical protein
MFKTRFTLIAAMLAVLLVSLAFSSPIASDPEAVDTSWPSRPDYSHLDEKPVLSVSNEDYYQRHPELRPAEESAVDTTDYFFRHLELQASTSFLADTSDYFVRHPELRSDLTASVETTSDGAPLDECFDVPVSELTACREASQSPSP